MRVPGMCSVAGALIVELTGGKEDLGRGTLFLC